MDIFILNQITFPSNEWSLSFFSIISSLVDLVFGGNVQSRIKVNPPDAATTQLILAEIVCAVEQLHNTDILHGDLAFQNILIDDKGHFILIDFGQSKRLSKIGASKLDWNNLSFMCREIFSYPYQNSSQATLVELLKNMTDKQLPGMTSSKIILVYQMCPFAITRNTISDKIFVTEKFSLIK